jgi:hypothetical protein
MVDHYGMDRTPMIVYFVGPIVGGILGVLVYDLIARARVGSAPELGGIEKSAVEGESKHAWMMSLPPSSQTVT